MPCQVSADENYEVRRQGRTQNIVKEVQPLKMQQKRLPTVIGKLYLLNLKRTLTLEKLHIITSFDGYVICGIP